jgi:hypothetical protein
MWPDPDRLIRAYERLPAHDNGFGAARDWRQIPSIWPRLRSCGRTSGITRLRAHLDVDVQVADLGAYDAAFGTGKVA